MKVESRNNYGAVSTNKIFGGQNDHFEVFERE